jgi:hypothetical protein
VGGARSTRGVEGRCIHGFDEGKEGKRPLGSPRCRWEGNVMLGFQEI